MAINGQDKKLEAMEMLTERKSNVDVLNQVGEKEFY